MNLIQKSDIFLSKTLVITEVGSGAVPSRQFRLFDTDIQTQDT